MEDLSFAEFLIKTTYLVAVILFVIGLKRMSSPRTARGGVVWAGWGMVLATLVTFLHFWDNPDWTNITLIVLGIGIGGAIAWWTGKKVAMTDMPQMIALYNGMGGGAAGAIAAVTLYKGVPLGVDGEPSLSIGFLAVLGGLIGAVSFSGSLIAFAKLQGWMTKPIRFKSANQVNAALLLATLVIGMFLLGNYSTHIVLVSLFFLLALIVGVTLTNPIGGADMPVVISLYNALTGLAVAFKGFVLGNEAMIIAGTVVGAAGTLLTQLMAKAMNRSLASVLFSAFGDEAVAGGGEVTGSMKPIEPSDAGVMMAYADRVIIVPGYGLAVAQAQHKVWELAQLLRDKSVKVSFAIHPVAGRMPGHMNVLLAEAGVPYDLIFDLDEINADFEKTDVVLVIGANDVVNPVARTDPSSPIYGMPILNADKAKNVIVNKRGKGKGFSGIENHLFYLDNTRMLYGDAQSAVAELIHAVKAS